MAAPLVEFRCQTCGEARLLKDIVAVEYICFHPGRRRGRKARVMVPGTAQVVVRNAMNPDKR